MSRVPRRVARTVLRGARRSNAPRLPDSLHWLRDTVYREDHSTARTGSGPRVMAALRNLAVGAIHLLGRRDITETTRWATRVMDRPFKILQVIT
ncbi:MAG: hypothetical protein ACRDRS_01835 [Pseudonocardiaceae bacterium]